MLTVKDHSRDSAGMDYVYPVVSRRAGGVSIGVNLNTNNACNWACIYCQVPDLVRGGPMPISLVQLEKELRALLDRVVYGDFLEKNTPPEARRLVDIAFSGNGEPTSAEEFADVVDLVGRVMRDFGLERSIVLRLITNGSLMHRKSVQRGIKTIGASGGEVWFKIDRATANGVAHVNGVRLSPEKILASLNLCSELAPTWVQSCFFAEDGCSPSEEETLAYLDLLNQAKKKIRGVHLYGLARPSMQPNAQRLTPLDSETMLNLAQRIRDLGVGVVVSP